MRAAGVLVALALAGCGPPAPRDATWFQAHPEEAARVAEACRAGSRTNECENARTALSRLKAQARKARYRKGFE